MLVLKIKITLNKWRSGWFHSRVTKGNDSRLRSCHLFSIHLSLSDSFGLFPMSSSFSYAKSALMLMESTANREWLRGFDLFLLNWFRHSKVGSKSRKIMPRKSKSHRARWTSKAGKKTLELLRRSWLLWTVFFEFFLAMLSLSRILDMLLSI